MENNLVLDLTHGIVETEQYKAWQFPGGEIHFRLHGDFMKKLASSQHGEPVHVITRMNTANKFLFTCLVLDQLAKDYDNKISLFVPYFPYQQADRDFAEGEPFALNTAIKLLTSIRIDAVAVFDPHSDVLPALLQSRIPSVSVIDNSDFIYSVLAKITAARTKEDEWWSLQQNLTILSPDAGAYKKIFKLAEKIEFEGSVESANKFRRHDDGQVFVRLSTDDFHGRDILIIDDICMGGATFINLAKELRGRNVGRLYLAVSHGVFNNGFGELGEHFSKIFSTDSFRSHHTSDKLEILSL